MKCMVFRLIIDSRENAGKKLPSPVSAHLEKCPQCAAYMNIGTQLRSEEPPSGISDSSMSEIRGKIIAGLSEIDREKKRRTVMRLPALIPTAAVFIILVISLGVVLFRGVTPPVNPGNSKPVTSFITTSKNIGNLQNLFSKAESPIRKEAEELKRSVRSAGEYLKSVMDFGLPGIPD